MDDNTADNPRGTAVLLLNDVGEYLLHLRDNIEDICDPGRWSLPGGSREGTETPRQAAVRELYEELGLRVPDLHELGVVPIPGPDGAVDGWIQVFAGRWNGNADRLEVMEGVMVRFFPASMVDRLRMSAWAAAVIRAHHTGQYPNSLPALRAGTGSAGSRPTPNMVGAHLLLIRDRHVLLGLRSENTAYAPSHWQVIAGTVELESARACARREAHEETGIHINEKDLDHVHTVHIKEQAGPPMIEMFFQPRTWRGEPELREPDRCLRWEWHPLDNLPEPLVEYTRIALDGIARGRTWSELGWNAAGGGR